LGAAALSATERAEADAAAGSGLNLLKVRADTRPEKVVEAIYEYLESLRSGRRKTPTDAAGAASRLGYAYGLQLERALGWSWGVVSLPDRQLLFGVVSPDAALVAYPLHSLYGQVLQPSRPNTTLLVFNMLTSGNTPAAAPGAYVGVG
jgi:hypothetical protein